MADKCEQNTCNNGGTCENTNYGEYPNYKWTALCHCSETFTGKRCQHCR